ncbi:MAG: hypothetical protein VXA46_05450 [Aquiluna sp.]
MAKKSKQVIEKDEEALTDEEPKEVWDDLFQQAMNWSETHLEKCVTEAAAEGVPAMMIALQMFTLVIRGLEHNGWDEEQIVKRVRDHFPKEAS